MAILDEESITSLSSIYTDIQRKIKELEEEKAEVKAKLFLYFDQTVGKDQPAEIDCGDGFAFARVQRESKSINEKKLEEILKPEAWKKVTITRRELDESKLNKAIADGLVNKSDVKKAVVVKTSFAFTHPKFKPAEK